MIATGQSCLLSFDREVLTSVLEGGRRGFSAHSCSFPRDSTRGIWGSHVPIHPATVMSYENGCSIVLAASFHRLTSVTLAKGVSIPKGCPFCEDVRPLPRK